MIGQLIAAGLKLEDLINLKRLKDGAVLAKTYHERRNRLRHNSREDVILYLQKWAEVLEERFDSEWPLQKDYVFVMKL